MGEAFLIFQLFAVFCLTIFLLNKYGNWRKQHFIVLLSTLIGWYFSFLIIVLLPLDLSMVSFFVLLVFLLSERDWRFMLVCEVKFF